MSAVAIILIAILLTVAISAVGICIISKLRNHHRKQTLMEHAQYDCIITVPPVPPVPPHIILRTKAGLCDTVDTRSSTNQKTKTNVEPSEVACSAAAADSPASDGFGNGVGENRDPGERDNIDAEINELQEVKFNENQTKERQADRSCIEVKGPGEIENSSTVTRVQIQENSSYQSSTNVLAINPAYGTNIANAP